MTSGNISPSVGHALLGIDFGSSHHKATYLSRSGAIVHLSNSAGEVKHRSSVVLGKDGLLFGNQAYHARFIDLDRHCASPKLALGDDRAWSDSQGREWNASQLLGCQTNWLADMCEARTGVRPTYITLSVPVDFDAKQRREMVDAVESEGFEVVVVVDEANAACLGADSDALPDGVIFVGDHGAKTTDLTVVKKLGDDMEVLATCGIDVGMLDFQSLLQQRVKEEVESNHGVQLDPKAHPVEMADLSERCERGILTLSDCDDAVIVCTCDGTLTTVTVRREDFEASAQQLIEKVATGVQEVLAEANVAPKDIAAARLVGGGSNVPCIRAAVESVLERDIEPVGDPIMQTARGVLIAGRLELQRQGRPLIIDGHRLPPIPLNKREVLTQDIGITVLGDDDDTLMDPVIRRNAVLPCEVTRPFRLAVDGQTTVRIEVLEGRAGEAATDCHVIGHLDLVGLPAVTGRPHQIDVTYKVDAKRIVHVIGKDAESGQTGDLTLAC